MKYVITDTGEAKVGGGFHMDLARGLSGNVIAAGHCELNADGTYRVFGRSIGYNINSKPEDAKRLDEILSPVLV